ncbi:hypothetical protein F503_06133 [Ophiostoma piceae UAMH 11346]|uniref:Uncharacterized protein n=1 Tax=Ophiostoma piceae (strain UAMH 11346) TaxID=1262450 RepID=S3BLL7_OPHP1|nr:hypothetical protein F503_06133 [Ophiostoma piceae UAMH 11346]
MCYFEQTRWTCGYWKWGNFRQQCPKEYRTGETCGLKLVYTTSYKSENCKLCEQIEKKNRRLEKLQRDVERWRQEGNRPATIEKTERDIEEIAERVNQLWEDHIGRQASIS